ncbi:MAG: hypothetical protein AAF654_00565 [Myxococcota bacterium]
MGLLNVILGAIAFFVILATGIRLVYVGVRTQGREERAFGTCWLLWSLLQLAVILGPVPPPAPVGVLIGLCYTALVCGLFWSVSVLQGEQTGLARSLPWAALGVMAGAFALQALTSGFAVSQLTSATTWAGRALCVIGLSLHFAITVRALRKQIRRSKLGLHSPPLIKRLSLLAFAFGTIILVMIFIIISALRVVPTDVLVVSRPTLAAIASVSIWFGCFPLGSERAHA